MYDPRLMSLEELCDERGLTSAQVGYLHRTGRLVGVRFGRRILFARRAVDAFFGGLEAQAMKASGMEAKP